MAFKHLLVPTDFSDPAQLALRHATEEAALHRARVTLLHVMPPSAGTDVYYITGAPVAGAGAGLDPFAGGRLAPQVPAHETVVRRDRGEEALTKLKDLVPAAYRDQWTAEVASGQPADAIVRIAQERDVDLIVMGTHGRTGLQHVLLGSVAEKVVRLAPCPVLTVRPKRQASPA
jgi:nucleotide-binding universal stress UspA family protein